MTPQSKILESFVETNLNSRLKRLSYNLRKAAKHPEDPKSIHDLRVAIRRYTQGLRIFRYLLDGGRVKKMRRRLKRIMDVCGTIRNTDIALDVIKASGVSAPVLLQQHLSKGRSKAARDLADQLAGSKPGKTTRQWKSWLRAKPGPAQTVASSARRILGPLMKRFLSAGVVAANPGTTPAEMHQFRLQAKRLRYTLEIFGPEAGQESKRWIARVRALQEHLGAINDCVTTRDLIAEPGQKSQALRKTKAAVERLLAQRIHIFRKYWTEHMPFEVRRSWQTKAGKIETTKK